MFMSQSCTKCATSKVNKINNLTPSVLTPSWFPRGGSYICWMDKHAFLPCFFLFFITRRKRMTTQAQKWRSWEDTVDLCIARGSFQTVQDSYLVLRTCPSDTGTSEVLQTLCCTKDMPILSGIWILVPAACTLPAVPTIALQGSGRLIGRTRCEYTQAIWRTWTVSSSTPIPTT